MKRNQQGFTLIELMIVIAIIAILMAYAIPAYRDYSVRAKVGEGVSLAAAAKQAVSETFIDTGVFPTDNASAGLAPAASINGANVTGIEVGANGVITVTFGLGSAGTADPEITGDTLIHTPNSATGAGSITWICSSTDIEDRYLPGECR